MKILGISAFYHDSAACLIDNGEIVAAAQEERFTRKKHDPSFPKYAIQYCLKEDNISLTDIDAVVFYDKPFITFDRLLETYLAFAPRGFRSFITSMPIWIKEKLFLSKTLESNFKTHFQTLPKKLLFSNHHESHAASAYFPSPFEKAAVLCMDGVGEWATTTVWKGENNNLTPLWEIRFPHSIGLLYSAITYYTGFKVNSGEYKVMGLAPYGNPIYVDKILNNIIDLKEDGTFRLDMSYFNYCAGLTMTSEKFHRLFGGPPRKPESEVTQKEMDLARSIQVVTEEVLLKLGHTIRKETGFNNLCLAGGVALNCVANGKLLKSGIFDNIFIQPAAGDAGGAVGAALAAYHTFFEKPRSAVKPDAMKGSFLGPKFSSTEIKHFLEAHKLPAKHYQNETELLDRVATDLAGEKVIGWMNGRMEFGPRSLGCRSILADPRSKKMQSQLNLKIKFRESFRPFAPSVLREKVSEYFELNVDSPYMLLVAPVSEKHRIAIKDTEKNLWGIDLLNVPKSDIPSVTHVDYSARVQTVHEDTNSRYYGLIKKFEEKTGCAVLVNTSFNVRGEPIVCSPEDAYRCFMRTDMDTLVLENYVLDKKDQPKTIEDFSWMQEFQLD